MRMFLTVALALGAVFTGFAQQKPKIRQVTPAYTKPTEAVTMFREYCAACHGQDGKGNGPAAAAMKSQPSNLTVLSRDNGGKFPALKVKQSITGDSMSMAHGTNDMPVWGDLFRSMNSDRAVAAIRVANLTDYIASIQEQ